MAHRCQRAQHQRVRRSEIAAKAEQHLGGALHVLVVAQPRDLGVYALRHSKVHGPTVAGEAAAEEVQQVEGVADAETLPGGVPQLRVVATAEAELRQRRRQVRRAGAPQQHGLEPPSVRRQRRPRGVEVVGQELGERACEMAERAPGAHREGTVQDGEAERRQQVPLHLHRYDQPAGAALLQPVGKRQVQLRISVQNPGATPYQQPVVAQQCGH
ncbi:dTDP-4-dehydro-6-deoxyglucose aminotransferase [Babesia caballi]|uniref:dTDP-4-dehydro-6-deoxyglucose aminotransferase n=1 Tax=Babesia caballi TaxID=5871 RepID=A0AAV4LVJ9_BABCB|nr:dTDP-4-dehydro-6-deoxyglucose aminotransferase [Babesia caballi]